MGWGLASDQEGELKFSWICGEALWDSSWLLTSRGGGASFLGYVREALWMQFGF